LDNARADVFPELHDVSGIEARRTRVTSVQQFVAAQIPQRLFENGRALFEQPFSAAALTTPNSQPK
jgi:hypothetical protein